MLISKTHFLFILHLLPLSFHSPSPSSIPFPLPPPLLGSRWEHIAHLLLLLTSRTEGSDSEISLKLSTLSNPTSLCQSFQKWNMNRENKWMQEQLIKKYSLAGKNIVNAQGVNLRICRWKRAMGTLWGIFPEPQFTTSVSWSLARTPEAPAQSRNCQTSVSPYR